MARGLVRVAPELGIGVAFWPNTKLTKREAENVYEKTD